LPSDPDVFLFYSNRVVKTGAQLMKTFIYAVGLLLVSSTSIAHDLTIKLENIKSIKGFLYVGLHNSESTWMKDTPGLQGQKILMTENPVIIFKDLPSGSYGVTLYQDENDSGKIDKNAIGIPTEPYGFSNNGGSFGPPSFKDSVVSVMENKEITIYLQ
jgi:uncharacterized protein (DUF2141 family)